MILVFNKTDIVSHEKCVEWLRDFEKFQEALSYAEESYMNSLMNSMNLMLEEFYSQLNVVGVSSVTGEGMDEFFEKVNVSLKEYESDYLPFLKSKMEKKKNAELAHTFIFSF
ncbi:hypothetical protein BB560_003718 [Smittium megazygosporum]|uniref:GPN-loop GTPase n=1 Tax=Smittium megazygosporum TaxID=133381 RepID=A0A2T9ZBB4_9FUNG|nr:hypothetical protein BB560_003718 [Smittium megazygosporum]